MKECLLKTNSIVNMFDWLYDLTSSNPILLIVFAIVILVFWVWVFVVGLGVALAIMHKVLMFLLPFRIDDDL